MKYDKTKEVDYNYWENEFDGQEHYMTAYDYNEYAQIRRIIFNYVDENDQVLDVGCASGNSLELGESTGKKFMYKGVDYTKSFIEACHKRRPDVDWEVQDARKLLETDKSWDEVILYDVLDNLDGWETAIDEAIRVARKRIVITMWKDKDMEAKLDYLKEKEIAVDKIEIKGDMVHYHYILIAHLGG